MGGLREVWEGIEVDGPVEGLRMFGISGISGILAAYHGHCSCQCHVKPYHVMSPECDKRLSRRQFRH